MDTIVPLTQGRMLASVLPQAKLIELPGVGHLGHELNPEIVNPVLIAYLINR